MVRPKGSKASKTVALIDDSVDINGSFLECLSNLLVSMSPDYPGFPSLTLKEKLANSDYDFTKHEKLFLLTSLKALEKLASELRLNDLTPLINEVDKRIYQVEQLKQLDAEAMDAKDSLVV